MALTEKQLRAFVPRNYFLKEPYNVTVPEGEEEVTTSYGIPNTDAFTNSGDGGGGGGSFEPYTAQTLGMGPYEPGHWSYRTNRGSSVDGGYLPGYEPEENYMNKIGGIIKSGIGMAIPGGNFLMGLAEDQARGNRLNASDNAFIDRQLGIQEQNIHGIGNLDNQDRYGYNKESMFGNYADKVKERANIARQKAKDNENDPKYQVRPIDAYYLEKEKELEETNKIIAANDRARQRATANKIRAGAFKNPDGTDIYSGTNIHGGDDTTTITTTDQNQTGDGGSIDLNPSTDRDRGRSRKEGETGQIAGGHHFRSGGRVYLNLGGLASMLGREGFADGGLDWDEGGDTPMPGGGHGSGHEDAVAAMGGNNEPPTDNLNISPFVNTVDGTPVELGAVSNTKLGRLKAMIGFKNLNEALTYGKGDDTVINSLDDVRNLLDPSLSLNTQIGPVDVNAYKDIDSYGLRTNIGPVNLGYQDLNNQKRADISYAPNDKFNIGATTDFDNINLGATYNKGPFTVGGTIDDMGNWNTQAGLKYAFNNGGLASIL